MSLQSMAANIMAVKSSTESMKQ